MGSFRDGEGMTPSDNSGVPDLPPEWGVVVIPDDPSELDRESWQLRRQQRRSARKAKWRRRFGLPPRTAPEDENPPVGTPLLIMAIAIVAALTSLFAITLSTRTNSATPTTANPPAAVATPQLIDLTLRDGNGSKVSVGHKLPAAILLLDGCACQQLIQDTVKAAPTGVTVLVVDHIAPSLPEGVKATALADPQQALRATYGPGPDRSAKLGGDVTAIMVDSSGNVVKTVNNAIAIADFQDALVALGH
jgi:hypothetical protein